MRVGRVEWVSVLVQTTQAVWRCCWNTRLGRSRRAGWATQGERMCGRADVWCELMCECVATGFATIHVHAMRAYLLRDFVCVAGLVI